DCADFLALLAHDRFAYYLIRAQGIETVHCAIAGGCHPVLCLLRPLLKFLLGRLPALLQLIAGFGCPVSHSVRSTLGIFVHRRALWLRCRRVTGITSIAPGEANREKRAARQDRKIRFVVHVLTPVAVTCVCEIPPAVVLQAITVPLKKGLFSRSQAAAASSAAASKKETHSC